MVDAAHLAPLEWEFLSLHEPMLWDARILGLTIGLIWARLDLGDEIERLVENAGHTLRVRGLLLPCPHICVDRLLS